MEKWQWKNLTPPIIFVFCPLPPFGFPCQCFSKNQSPLTQFYKHYIRREGLWQLISNSQHCSQYCATHSTIPSHLSILIYFCGWLSYENHFCPFEFSLNKTLLGHPPPTILSFHTENPEIYLSTKIKFSIFVQAKLGRHHHYGNINKHSTVIWVIFFLLWTQIFFLLVGYQKTWISEAEYAIYTNVWFTWRKK